MKQTVKVIFCFVLLVLFTGVSAHALERVSGANATLDIIPGAKAAALGGAILAVEDDYINLFLNSYQLASNEYVWGSFSHVAYYEGTFFDIASMTVPFAENQSLGISFSRFGANDIPWIKEGEALPEGSDYRTLNIADYVFSVVYGRKLFRNLDFGVSLHGLYRELDQTGFGFRGDATLRYRLPCHFSVASLLKGWTSSAAKWEEGSSEYESPEVYLAASWWAPVPYFYGKLLLYYQSAGLFHHEARDLDFDSEPRGGRIWDSPADWFSGSRAGAEYVFDFGLSLRFGLASFTTFESFTAGAGFVLSEFLKVDYAFESHPMLSSVHRVSISVSPWLFFNKPKRKQKEEVIYTEKEELITKSEEVSPVSESTEDQKNTEETKQATETETEILENTGSFSWEE